MEKAAKQAAIESNNDRIEYSVIFNNLIMILFLI